MAVLSITDLFNTAIRLASDMVLKTFGIGTKYWYVLLIVAISILFLICCIKIRNLNYMYSNILYY